MNSKIIFVITFLISLILQIILNYLMYNKEQEDEKYKVKFIKMSIICYMYFFIFSIIIYRIVRTEFYFNMYGIYYLSYYLLTKKKNLENDKTKKILALSMPIATIYFLINYVIKILNKW